MDLPQGGMYYEPRSLWSLLEVNSGTAYRGGLWNQEHFRNTGKYPITLTRMAVSSANQIWDWPGFTFSTFGGQQSFPTMLGTTSQQIRVPFRQNYTRSEVRTGSFRPRPTAEPSTNLFAPGAPPLPGTGDGDLLPINGYGPLYQQTRLNFAHPLYLPQFGSIQFELSSLDDWSQNIGGVPIGNVLGDNDLESIRASVAYFEAGGLFSGSARIKDVEIPVRAADVNRLYRTIEGWPYPLPVDPAPRQRQRCSVVGFTGHIYGNRVQSAGSNPIGDHQNSGALGLV